MTDTIFALSSGAPPAAVAIVRVSGPRAAETLRVLGGTFPEPRRATLVNLWAAEGGLIDRALVLWLPGPGTVTGEDVVELHLHGGRAVVAAVEGELLRISGLRRAEAGEFTRRAFANGRLDLAEAEGLADLLAAETELQRATAMAMAGGALSRPVEAWRARVLALGAAIEAVLDFSDEDDVTVLPASLADDCARLADELSAWLARPRAELLREGFRVVLAGSPNAGKSTLFNVLTQSEAAITSPLPGTTRDVIVRPVALDGVPFAFFDTAGLHQGSGDAIEAIGMDRARDAVAQADLVLWLGEEGEDGTSRSAWEIEARCDVPDRAIKRAPRHRVSARTGEGIDALRADLIATARAAMPGPGEAAISERQGRLLGECRAGLIGAAKEEDPLLAAEALRVARLALDCLVGRSGTEDMLDALFGRFCIGK